jgi:hypothetical protein
VETLAVDRFGKGVRLLNKVEESGIIDELLDTYAGGSSRSSYNNNRNGSAYNGGRGNQRGRDAA